MRQTLRSKVVLFSEVLLNLVNSIAILNQVSIHSFTCNLHLIGMQSVNNAVIVSVVCYISTTRKVYTEQIPTATCPTFYNSKKISGAKYVIF